MLSRKVAADFLSKFDDSKRALAKLMAQENITVQIVNGAPTAYFEPITRVLTLPNWPNISVDQMDLLIGHEVGHALFTDSSFLEKIIKTKSRGVMSYFNVVEDARIERKMQDIYPGLKRVFYNGYQQFFTNGPILNGKDDYFVDADGKKLHVKKMRLIDRINAYYKVGAFINVPFKDEERVWLSKIDKCADMDMALDIAIALHKLAKEEDKEDKQQQGQQKQKGQKGQGVPQPGDPCDDGDESEDGEEGESKSKSKKSKKDADKKDKKEKSGGDEDGDEQDDTEDGDGAGDEGAEESDGSGDGDGDSEGDDSEDSDSDADGDGEGDGDSDEDDEDADDSSNGGNGAGDGKNDDPMSETDKMIADAMKKMAEAQQQQPAHNVRHLLIRPLSDQIVNKRTLSATDWANKALETIKQGSSEQDMNRLLDRVETEWNARFKATAQFMAAEFERKKAAKNLQNAKVAKTGRLNMGKLHAYKYTEDLFLRSLTVPNGQSHGIVMIIDGSSSMNGVFGHVLDQVILFAMFAFQCRIPFEAYMFTNSCESGYSGYGGDVPQGIADISMGPLTLTVSNDGRLVGIVNTSDRVGFKKQIRALHASRQKFSGQLQPTERQGFGNAFNACKQIPYMNHGGTPLYTGILLAERHVARMKRTLKLDKVMTVIITDGADGSGLQFEEQKPNSYGRVQRQFSAVNTGLVVRDTVTKKNHIFVEQNGTNFTLPANALMQLLLDIIKSRHDARNIMLYLQEGSSGRSTVSVNHFLMKAGQKTPPNFTAVEVDKQFTLNNQFVVPKDVSVADLTLVMPTENLEMKDDNFSKVNTRNMSQQQIGAAFTDVQIKGKLNRVFVNTLIPFLA